MSSPRAGASKAGGDGSRHAGSGVDWRALLSRATSAHSDWPDKDELLDVVYWSRQALAAVLGCLWALLPFTGVLAIGAYAALSTVLGHLYVTSYQRVDEEAVGGFWELAKEGFGSAIATFMVCWIVMYSALHFQ